MIIREIVNAAEAGAGIFLLLAAGVALLRISRAAVALMGRTEITVHPLQGPAIVRGPADAPIRQDLPAAAIEVQESLASEHPPGGLFETPAEAVDRVARRRGLDREQLAAAARARGVPV